MQPKKVKKTFPNNMYDNLKAYFNQHYQSSSNQERIDAFFLDVRQNRDVISKMDQLQGSVDQQIQNRLILTNYINELLILKGKMSFGRQNFSCPIKFSWTDTIRNEVISSYNIYFEIYNSLYNLAITYYCIGRAYGESAKEKRNVKRDSVINYKKALYLFQELREEAQCHISQKELPYDLHPQFLNYYCTLCKIYGNMEVTQICGSSSESEYRLQAKILLYISEEFSRAHKQSLAKPTCKVMDEEYQNYLANRLHYYRAIMYQKLRDSAFKKFDNTGTGYGEAFYFQGKLFQRLVECSKNLQLCGRYVDGSKFREVYKREMKMGKDMQEKNLKIYHQAGPREEDLVLEAKNMCDPLLPEDLYIGKNKKKAKEEGDKNCPDLNMMIPSKMKEMIERYKKRMTDFVLQGLANTDTERSINAFIQNFNLPYFITVRKETGINHIITFPDQLWEKINYIQHLGGTLTLTNMMQDIMNQSNYLMDSLHNTLNSFSNEENDDNLMRQKYGTKWIRKSSNMLNGNYILSLNNHIAGLEKTRTFDMKQNDDLIQNAKYFETFLLSKTKLEEQIPGQKERATILTTDEEKLRKEILNLYEMIDQVTGIVEPLFERINDDALVINYFVDVLDHLTTEQAVYAQNKEDYTKKINEVQKINESIKEKKEVVEKCVNDAQSSLDQRKNAKNESNSEVMNFFSTLEQNANLYMEFYEKMQKGKNYYDELQNKIEGVIQASNIWMIKRNEEKNVLINSIRRDGGTAYSGSDSSLFSGAGDYTNPSQNRYTNMGMK